MTQFQMTTFRQAWSGVAALLVADPVILPTSNNLKSIPFELLHGAFPQIGWNQPRNVRTALYISSRYMTVPFAESLAVYMASYPLKNQLPSKEFLEEALRAPPLYFETDERTLQGVCCVCYKKGCLGRCPNPGCGLLMCAFVQTWCTLTMPSVSYRFQAAERKGR